MNFKLAGIAIVVVVLGAFAQTKTMQIAGVSRSYIVHAPSGLTKPPLVLNFHGYDMDAASEQSYTKMDQIADREKFIVVYPNAINKSWDLSGPNDYAFVLAIIDTIKATYHIDTTRIYSCGFSQGGFMTYQLACRYSNIFAAIAPTSGTVSGTCDLKRPVPLRMTFGTNEFDRGATQTAQFMQSVTTWVEMLECPETPVITRPYPASNPNSLVTRLYYGPCAGGTEVIADSVRTGGHEWPMNTSDRINNSEETWTFLKKWTLPPVTGALPQSVAVAKTAVSAYYASGMIVVNGISENNSVRLLDTRGRKIASASSPRQCRFDIARMPGGVYVVVVDGRYASFTQRVVVP